MTTYWIGMGIGELVTDRRPVWRWNERARVMLQRWGAPALLLSWVPFVGDAIVALAGASRAPFGWFTLWVTAGKLGRYALIGWGSAALQG
ncbi:MAG TPA: hypothetical protein VMS56_05230 [Thermoanaerobaculia bacterium]|nr:hypothetical protein [Thermoanaerobaculia bacterium]